MATKAVVYRLLAAHGLLDLQSRAFGIHHAPFHPSCQNQPLSANWLPNVMAALYTGYGGAFADMGNSLLAIPGTMLSDVAKAFKLGTDLGLGDIANAIFVRS